MRVKIRRSWRRAWQSKTSAVSRGAGNALSLEQFRTLLKRLFESQGRGSRHWAPLRLLCGAAAHVLEFLRCVVVGKRIHHGLQPAFDNQVQLVEG